jgi:hypothetical protein
MYTGVELQQKKKRKRKKTYGNENIRWKTIGEATQEVDRCCTPGREVAAGCQKMEAGGRG